LHYTVCLFSVCVCVRHVGWLYDVTGSYTVGFLTLACVALTALSLMSAVYIIHRRSKRAAKSSEEVVIQTLTDRKC